MLKRVVWSPASERDLEQITEYLQSKWGNKIALSFLGKLDSIIDLILVNPKLFPLIHKDLGIRKIVVTSQNSLFYREFDSRIEIVRLFDSRQDPKRLSFNF